MGEQNGAGSGLWQGEDYAPQARHHRSFDDWFLDRHPPRPGDHVVDAGCGTGEFTARIAAIASEGTVVGVEPEPAMLTLARTQSADNLEFRQGRLQELDRVCEAASADLVLSRAVFHWIPLEDYPRCYAAILRVLKPGGWLHAESGGAGNVARVAALLDDVAAERGLPPAAVTFPDPGVVLETLEEVGFHVPAGGVATVAQRRAFDREQLDGFLRTQAAVAYPATADDDVRAAFLADVERRRDELARHDGTYDQTFVRLDVLCQRPL